MTASDRRPTERDNHDHTAAGRRGAHGCLLLIATVLLLAWQPSIGAAASAPLAHASSDGRLIAFTDGD